MLPAASNPQQLEAGGDERLARCIRMLGTKATLHAGFHELDHWENIEILEMHPKAPIMTLHHLSLVSTTRPLTLPHFLSCSLCL